MNTIAAIPTIYKGYHFRSRHEAKCAAFFDLVEWPWEYEPFDMGGYIPDFLLKLPHRDVLLEVKPQGGADLKRAMAKIDASSWGREAMIFTGVVKEPRWSTCRIGYLREGEWDDVGWGECLLFRCECCKRISFYHSTASFRCRVNGCYDGDHYLGECLEVSSLWAQAANITQWNPHQ